jgi:predicted Zn-dependent protease
MAARAVVAVLAVAILACLAIMERDVRLTARAVEESHHRATLSQAARDLRAAKLLNPDGTLDISLAAVYRSAGQPQRGRATLEALLRREPDNLLAWGLLFAITQRDDPAAAARALAARRRLDPLNARPRR